MYSWNKSFLKIINAIQAFYAVKNQNHRKNIENFSDLQSEVIQIILEDKSSKQGFQYDRKNSFDTTTKTITDKKEKLLEGMNVSNVHVKTWEFLNKNQVSDTSLVRPLAIF